jgi:hypothetical protein
MNDSLIVARALLRLGPFAHAERPARHVRNTTDARDPAHEGSSQSRSVRSRDPWHTGAARAAFAIWATGASRSTHAPADKTRR